MARAGRRRRWAPPDIAPEFEAVIAAFADGLIDRSPLRARRLDLSLINDAFDDLAHTATNGKILVTP
jgi:threonine dehydrogenase-like Zn-dependent dehydrogenase